MKKDMLEPNEKCFKLKKVSVSGKCVPVMYDGGDEVIVKIYKINQVIPKFVTITKAPF